MRSTFKVLFYLNTSKRKKSGFCPLMGRITVDGQIAQFSLKEDVNPDCWNSKKERVVGKSREQIELNRKIEKTEQSIRDIYARTVYANGYVSAEQIKSELTRPVNKAGTLLQLFREHNAEYEKRVGKDRASGSYYVYKNSYRHLSGFIRSKYGLEDYPLGLLDMSFIDNYDLYLRTDAGLSSNTMVRHIIYLKKLVARALNQKIILRDPFPEYVRSKVKHQYRHISKEELKTIMSAQIQSKSVRFIRDMFVFSCFTGLAYSDMRQLSEKHLRKTSEGNFWIEIPRCKTKIESIIRLLDIPLAIIEKYRLERKDGLLFNIPSRMSICRNLRKIELLCGINHLHFHMARHTFATQICLTNGVSMEALGKMMGHSSIQSSQIYGEITNQKIATDMKRLAGRIKNKLIIDN
jgi:site-specific recombinase XerD